MKKYNHLTKEQRYTISVCLRKRMSLSAIAKLIDVSKSTVSREIKKNSNMYRHYVAIDAQQFSEIRKKIPRRPRKLSKEDWQEIEQCLKRHWSPETIVGVRKREGKTCVSIEWIYHIIRRDKERGGILYTYLPHHLKHRKKPVSSRIPIKDRVSIDERPAVVDSKSRFGDWELDTIVGKDGKGAIITLVERTTKKMLMAKSPKGKNAKAVAKVVVPTELSSLNTSTSQKCCTPRSISLTRTPRGKRDLSRTPTNLSGNISPKTPISLHFQTTTFSLPRLN